MLAGGLAIAGIVVGICTLVILEWFVLDAVNYFCGLFGVAIIILVPLSILAGSSLRRRRKEIKHDY